LYQLPKALIYFLPTSTSLLKLVESYDNKKKNFFGTPSPTNIYWEKKQNDGSYTTVDVSGNSRYSGGSLLSPNLVITNAAFSDSGTYRILVGLGVPDTEQNRVAWFPSSTSPGIVIDTANKPSKTNEKYC
jgi:hypothetical protein